MILEKVQQLLEREDAQADDEILALVPELVTFCEQLETELNGRVSRLERSVAEINRKLFGERPC